MDPSPKVASPSPLSLRTGLPLAILTGLLYFVAFPGVDVWPFAFVALAPLMVALRGQTPRRGLLLGWVSGFVMTMTGFYWLLEMLKTFSGFATPVCLVFMSLLCAYQAGRIAVMGWLCALGEKRGWRFGLVFALGFATSELLFPLLFPWYFGATVHQVLPVLQIAELGGPIAVGLVVAAVNLVVAELVFARLDRRPIAKRTVLGLGVVVLGAVIYGSIRIPMVDAQVRQAPKAQVGLVQANMSLVGKRRDRAEGLRRHLDLTKSLQAQSPLDLVVWSETSVMSAIAEDEAAERVPQGVGRHIGTNAIFGAVLARQVEDVREVVFFNSAIATNEKGSVVGRYDKQYLLAFGEYLPLGEWFPILYAWSPNSGRFSPGTSLEPLLVQGHPVATIICYEDLLPSFVNSMLRQGGGQLLVNMTNDAWFGDSIEPKTHMILAKLRAVEQRRYLVRSTNSGMSGVVDPVGRLIGSTPTFQQATLRREIAWMDGSTFYRWVGDIPWWAAALASLFLAFRSPGPKAWRWAVKSGTLPPPGAPPEKGSSSTDSETPEA